MKNKNDYKKKIGKFNKQQKLRNAKLQKDLYHTFIIKTRIEAISILLFLILMGVIVLEIIR